MIARRKCLISAILGMGLLVGCDKAPPPPPADVPQPAKKVETAPTTQQLLSAPRKTLALGNLPFSMEVPEGWAIHDPGEPGTVSLQMLDGPIIGGEAHLMLRQRENISPERMKLVIDHARKDPTPHADGTVKTQVHGDAELQVIERRIIPPPQASAVGVDKPVEWRLTIFMQGGINYEQYEITFIDLSPAAYAANGDLLNDIVQSLKPLDLTHPPI